MRVCVCVCLSVCLSMALRFIMAVNFYSAPAAAMLALWRDVKIHSHDNFTKSILRNIPSVTKIDLFVCYA